MKTMGRKNRKFVCRQSDSRIYLRSGLRIDGSGHPFESVAARHISRVRYPSSICPVSSQGTIDQSKRRIIVIGVGGICLECMMSFACL